MNSKTEAWVEEVMQGQSVGKTVAESRWGPWAESCILPFYSVYEWGWAQEAEVGMS